MWLPSQLLAELISSSPSMEHEINKWRQTPSAVGRLDHIQDGAISNGGKFFDNSPERDAPKEPQVAITLGFDG